MAAVETAQPIIETHGPTRGFKRMRAVDGLDLSAQPGTLFGLMGPDGVGKTTTLRLLAVLLHITAGSATIAGHDLAGQLDRLGSAATRQQPPVRAQSDIADPRRVAARNVAQRSAGVSVNQAVAAGGTPGRRPPRNGW